jgi:hypothetical protein
VEILIVSNEKSLSRTLYERSLPAPVYFPAGNPGEDLYALSTCNYLIGPPSTFSLMAAFYRDANVYWIFDKTLGLQADSFQKFDRLFRQIL